MATFGHECVFNCLKCGERGVNVHEMLEMWQKQFETHIRRFIMGGHIKSVAKQLNTIKCGPFTIGIASNQPKKCKSCKSHLIHKYLVRSGSNVVGAITYCRVLGMALGWSKVVGNGHEPAVQWCN